VNPFFLLQGVGQFWIMAACLPHLTAAVAPPPADTKPAPRKI
jgi:hypothetical protein